MKFKRLDIVRIIFQTHPYHLCVGWVKAANYNDPWPYLVKFKDNREMLFGDDELVKYVPMLCPKYLM